MSEKSQNPAVDSQFTLEYDLVVGRVIRAARRRAGLTQSDLVDILRSKALSGGAIGWTPLTPGLSNRERGKCPISVSDLRGYSAALGCDAGAVVAYAEKVAAAAIGGFGVVVVTGKRAPGLFDFSPQQVDRIIEKVEPFSGSIAPLTLRGWAW